MAKFLSQYELYRLLTRELPDGVYADGAPSAFYTTASIDSKAKCLATVYASLQSIYDNNYPQLTEERLEDWEIKVLGKTGNPFHSVSDRRQDILDKLQIIQSISVESITAAVQRTFDRADIISEDVQSPPVPTWYLDENELEFDTYLGFRDPNVPSNVLDFSIVEWGCEDGAWVLDVSHLDVETYLSALDPIFSVGIDCDLDYASLGLTAQDLEDIQNTAFTYEVRIYGHAEQIFIDYLNQQLTAIEPARSRHVILNDFPEP